MRLVNLTPHTINIIGEDGTVTVLPASGAIARVATVRQILPPIGDGTEIAAYRTTYGEVSGLPEPAPSTGYVVSAIVRQAAPHRPDVFSPGELVRDADGQPIGCRGLDCNY